MAGWIKKRPPRPDQDGNLRNPSPWRAEYRKPDGKIKSKSFRRKVDAEEWLRSQVGSMDRGVWVDPDAGKVSVGEWAYRWLAGRVRLAESTRASYEGIIRSRIVPTFGDVQLAKVTRSAVAEWVAAMTAEGLSPSRTRNAYNVLAAALDNAVAEGKIGRNVARGVELPRERPAEHRFLSAQEVDRLVAAMPTTADRALVLTLAYGGLRFGEAVALRVGRVDVLRRRLEVAENAPEVAGRIIFGEPKTHTRRTVHLPGFVADALAAHLGDVSADPDTLVWTAPKGGPLGYNSYRARVWNKAVEAAGLEGLTPHDLRHTSASLMYAAGADVKAIQEQLGHRSPAVTMNTYTHLFEGAYDPVMDRLDEEYRNLERPDSGPNVVDIEHRKRKKGS